MATKRDRDTQLKNEALRESASHFDTPPLCLLAETLYKQIVADRPVDAGIQFTQYDKLLRSINGVTACLMEGYSYADTQQELRFVRSARACAYEATAHARCLEFKINECTDLAKRINDYTLELLDKSFAADNATT